jgi:phosphoglycerol transferase MdoB-like AlkP superfamily enzyme
MIESLRAEDLRLITGRGETVTPNLDAFASRSVVFSAYLSNAFPSAPSVLSFHASAWPHRRKEIITDFAATRFDSMPERLRSLGYDTIYVGADPHFDNQDQWLTQWYAGVRDLVASGTQATDRNIVARAVAEIGQHDRGGGSRPLFAFVSTYSTHYPFRLPADSGETPLGSDADLPSRYRQVLRYTDQQLGTLLQTLDARDRRDHTVTVVVGDHSFYTNLRRTSGLPANDNEWTAAIIHGPRDLIGAPRTVADVASHVDMLPTVLGLVGDDRPTAAVGSDLFGPPRRGRRAALAVRPGGIRFDEGGYSVVVDARAPNGSEINRFAPETAGASPADLPTATQLLQWVDGWSYLIEHDRVWNPAFLRKSTEAAAR